MFLYIANNLKTASRVFAIWSGLIIGFKIREEVFYGSFVQEYNDILSDHYHKIRVLTELPNVQDSASKKGSLKDVQRARKAFKANIKFQKTNDAKQK